MQAGDQLDWSGIAASLIMLTKVRLASRAGLLTVLFVAVSRIWNNSYLADKPATTPGNTSVITAENVQPIFDLMVEYGEAEKKKAGSEKHQFLVVLATSKSEMEESPQWERLPDSIVGEFPRIDFLLNTNGSYPCANPGHALHGEIVAVDFGCFERILQNFERQLLNDNSKPWQLLFVYSYYVPCSGISDIGYSCAEELMNFARNRHDEIGVIVAYSHVFRADIVGSRKTNEERSLMSLKEGGIITFHRQKKGQYQQVVEYSPPRKVAENATSFQQNMNECLRNFSTADCCALDAADRSRLISFFTNDVTFRCTSKSFKTGLLTEGAKNELWKCMMTVTVSHFVNNCYILATCRSEMSPVTKCLRQTLQLDMWVAEW
nr:hypothetical protein BaRGS_013537 [Batillaria attramentaria]